MGFAERAVEACRRDWSAGRVDESHVRDVLKSKLADVGSLHEFTDPQCPMEVRMAAARVLAEKGLIDNVVVMALAEQERETLIELLRILGRKGAGLESLEALVASEDTMVRDAAVEMFRRTGQTDALFPLIFDQDDSVVRRIKRYIDEAGQRGETCRSREPA